MRPEQHGHTDRKPAEYDKGWSARRAGLPKDQNPNPPGPEADAWFAGWDEGEIPREIGS